MLSTAKLSSIKVQMKFSNREIKKDGSGLEKSLALYLSLLQKISDTNEKIPDYSNFLKEANSLDGFWNLQFFPSNHTPLMTFLLSLKTCIAQKNFLPLLDIKWDKINGGLKNVFHQMIPDLLINLNGIVLFPLLSKIADFFPDKTVQSLSWLLLKDINFVTEEPQKKISQGPLFGYIKKIIETKQTPHELLLFIRHEDADAGFGFKTYLNIAKVNFKELDPVFALLSLTKALRNIFEFSNPYEFSGKNCFEKILREAINNSSDSSEIFNLTKSILSIISKFITIYHELINNNVSPHSDIKKIFELMDIKDIKKATNSINNQKQILNQVSPKMRHFELQHTFDSDNKLISLSCSCSECSTLKIQNDFNTISDHYVNFYDDFFDQVSHIFDQIKLNNLTYNKKLFSLLGSDPDDNLSLRDLPTNLITAEGINYLKNKIKYLNEILFKMSFTNDKQVKEKEIKIYEKTIINKSKKLVDAKNYLQTLNHLNLLRTIDSITEGFFKLSQVFDLTKCLKTNFPYRLRSELTKKILSFKDSIDIKNKNNEFYLLYEQVVDFIKIFNSIQNYFNSLFIEYKHISESASKFNRTINRFQKQLDQLPSTHFLSQFFEGLKKISAGIEPNLFLISKMSSDNVSEACVNLLAYKNELQTYILDAANYIEKLKKKMGVLEEYTSALTQLPVSEDDSSDTPEAENISEENNVVPVLSEYPLANFNNIEVKENKNHLPSSSLQTSLVPKKSSTARFFKGLGYSFPAEIDKKSIETDYDFSYLNYSRSDSSQSQLCLTSYIDQAIIRKNYIKLCNEYETFINEVKEIKINPDDIEQVFSLRCIYLHSIASLANLFEKISIENVSSDLYGRLYYWFYRVRNSIFHIHFFDNYNWRDINLIERARILNETYILSSAFSSIKLFLDAFKSGNDQRVLFIFENFIENNLILIQLSQLRNIPCSSLISNELMRNRVISTVNNLQNRMRDCSTPE